MNLLTFNLEEQQLALHLAVVDRIVRMVEITPLPQSPDKVLGIINVHGKIIPVIDIRKIFGLTVRQIDLNDQLIIARTAKRKIALIVDLVKGLMQCSDNEVVEGNQIYPGVQYISGVAKTANGLLLINNIDEFLSLEDEEGLDEALTARAGTR